MNFGDMTAFVRLQADADTTDAPDANLQVYARMAYNDILAKVRGWAHLEVIYQLTTTALQASYPFTGFNTTDMDRVSSVIDNTGVGLRLTPITAGDADMIYSGQSAKTNTAQFYYVMNKTVYLYPTPSAVKTYFVRGFRSAAVWPNGPASLPDLPRVFDEAIAWYMLSKYFLGQEDTELAQLYMAEYERQVDTWIKSEQAKSKLSKPSIMGGQTNGRSFMDRVRGMLE